MLTRGKEKPKTCFGGIFAAWQAKIMTKQNTIYQIHPVE